MHVLHFFIVTSSYIYNMTVTKMSVPVLFTYCAWAKVQSAKPSTPVIRILLTDICI